MDDSSTDAPAIRHDSPTGVSAPRFSDMLVLFSPAERLALYVLTVVMGFSALALLAGANATVSVHVPSRGGSITEGVVAPARFVNPVLATSAADNDLTALVYAGLVRTLPSGETVPDMAESFTISDDGTVYTLTIREDALFHDGSRVTSADVLYTVKQVQDPAIKSPLRADWDGVIVATPDDRTVIFTLPHAYAPFMEDLSLGILPEHLWRDTLAEDFPFNPLNTHPIGSGPYRINEVEEDETGSAVRFHLEPFDDYVLGTSHIKSITIRLYANEEELVRAFNGGEIDAVAGVSADHLANMELADSTVIRATLPRVFGVFLNQNRAPVFADAGVRRALDVAIDKDRLIRATLGGFAVPLTGPLPQYTSTTYAPTASSTNAVSTAYTLESIEEARSILQAAGWVWSEESGEWKKGSSVLAFTLKTSDTPELAMTADAVATAWRQAGVRVDVEVHSLSELNSTVIRPREYDAILFGEVVGREPDLYAFWHSSQRNDPGLNLSLYTNANADTLLSQARATIEKQDREKLYEDFAALVQEDRPAIFLYAPDFLYVFPGSVQGVEIGSLTDASERYQNVHRWYTDTERVWEIFAQDTPTL